MKNPAKTPFRAPFAAPEQFAYGTLRAVAIVYAYSFHIPNDLVLIG